MYRKPATSLYDLSLGGLPGQSFIVYHLFRLNSTRDPGLRLAARVELQACTESFLDQENLILINELFVFPVSGQ